MPSCATDSSSWPAQNVAHFYINESLADAVVGATIDIVGEEARHAASVARVRVGERLYFGNGRGFVAEVVVRHVSRERVEAEVRGIPSTPPRSPRLTLVQALAKSDRDERSVEAATEVGVDAVMPWQAERSVSRWDAAKAERGRIRWQSIAREATKQSLNPWLPAVLPLATTADVVTSSDGLVIVLDVSGEPLHHLDPQKLARSSDIRVVVGPEGGLSQSERETFARSGAVIASLGPTILRTSTAGPVAVGVLSALLGRWG